MNEWKNRLRSQDAERRARLRTGPTADIEAGYADERDLIWRHIMTLPERQRAVLVLRYYEDLPDREIARHLGCAQVTVRSQAKRALTKLREVIEG
jgi:RNA polymerase sigma factor (sigma-70 family)